MNSLFPTVECKEDQPSYIRNLFNYQKKVEENSGLYSIRDLHLYDIDAALSVL